MSEPAERSVIHGAPKLEQPVPVAAQDETSLSEAFANAVNMSQDVGLPEHGVPEETESREKLKNKDPEQHEQTAFSIVAETPSTESKWEVGAQCQTVWSEDGLMYPAAVVAVDGERCRVRFTGYGNEEDTDLSALHAPDTVLQTQRQNPQDWEPGSRCRAVFSEDGLVYPALVLWVKGQRCRVRFDDYNNEEDQDISSLLNPDELYGCSRANPKGNSGSPSSTRSNCDRKWRRRREETQRESGGEKESARRDNQQNSTSEPADEKESVNQQRDEAGKPTSHSFSLFPPFFPPPQPGSGEPMSFIPPLPVWMSRGDESSSSASGETLSSMLMLWYICGFHTGSYVAQQQFRSTSKD